MAAAGSRRREREAFMNFAIEFDQEVDGRWIAEIPEIPGVIVYGATPSQAEANAKALALRVLADRPDSTDYDNDTDYLNAIPGMAESIIRSMNATMSEFENICGNRFFL